MRYTALLLLATPVIAQDQASMPRGEPVLVVVESGRTSRSAKARILNAVKKYECEDRVQPHELKALQNPQFYEVTDPRSVGGHARMADRNGKVTRVAFATVSSDEHYDAFLKQQMDRRGASAEFTGSKVNGVIRVPPAPIPAGQRRVVTWDDFYLSYADGVMVWGGDDSVQRLSKRSLAKVVRRAQKKQDFMMVRPGAMPPEVRKQFADLAIQVARRKLQQFDQETDEAYASRKLLGDTYIRLLRGVLFDVEEAEYWTERAEESDRGKMTVRLTPDSNLARFAASLRCRRASTFSQADPTELLSGGFAVTIADELKAVLLAWATGLPDLRLREALLNVTRELKQPSGVFTVRPSGVTVAVTRGTANESDSRTLADFATAQFNKIFPDTEPTVTLNEELVRLTSGEPVDLEVRIENRRDRNTIGFVRADLANWNTLPDESPLAGLISQLEKLCAYNETINRVDNLEPRTAWRETKGGFESFADKVSQEGNWKFSATLSVSGNTASIAWTAGRDIADLRTVQEMLARARIYKFKRSARYRQLRLRSRGR